MSYSQLIYLITVFLWSGCFAAWFRDISRYRINPYVWLDCKFLLFFAPFSSQWSSCLLVVMCIEKFFALYFPLKTRSICTVSMAKRVTLVVTLILVAVNLQSFFIFEPQVNAQGQKSCKLVRVPENYQMVYNQIEHTLHSFGPFSVMVLANGAIIYKFMQASCARDQGGTESTNQALSKSANRGTTMLVAISLAFIVLTGPVAITLAITNDFGPMLQAAIVLIRYVNHSINAVLYCMSGSRFRNALMKTFPFRLCSKNENLSNNSSRLSRSGTMTTSVNSSTYMVEVGSIANPT